MSETVHYKGTAIKIPNEGKTTQEVATALMDKYDPEKRERYYDDNRKNLSGLGVNNNFFYHIKTDTLYEITYSEHDLDEEIIEAKYIGFDNSQIGFELRYYNGGAGFEECLEEALDKIQ